MKKPDENLIAAYIDGKLSGKQLEDINDYVLKNPDLLKTINDTIRAKQIMSDDDKLIEIPWNLKDKAILQINAMLDRKPLIALKLIKNGLREIFNALSIPKEAVNYSVRGEVLESPVFHYEYRTDELEFGIYTFFEDSENIRVKLEIKDNDNHSVNGKVKLISKGNTIELKTTNDGLVEFSGIKRGEYEFVFDYVDILSVKTETKHQSLFLALE